MMQTLPDSEQYVIRVEYALYSKAFCRSCMTNIARHIVKVGLFRVNGCM